MTSDRQIASNRKNGRSSRGPRTAVGKANSSRNALRHGLAASLLDDPKMFAEVESLAHAIAGKGADNFRINQARIIAEAQFDLIRIQDAKVTLMNSHFAKSKAIIREVDVTPCSKGDDPGLESDDLVSETTCPQESAMPPPIEVLRQLSRLERYECRAISRRRRAMRAFLVRSTK
jgi:hypothetical protein